MRLELAPVLAVFLLACGPSLAGGDDLAQDETGEDETGEDDRGPLYLLTEGGGAVWVVDVTNPGTVELANIVPASEESFVTVVASPSSRWAALVTGEFANSSTSVWLHDFVEAPLEPAVELALDPAAGSARVWFAQDESGLAIETATQLGERTLVYVPLGDGGPEPSITIPDVPGPVYDAGFAGGSRFVMRISDAGTQELFVSAIVDGQPQAPVRLPEFDGTRAAAKWHADGEFLIYDTIDPQGSTGELHRRDLSAWPAHVVQTLGPFDWTGTAIHWWISADGSRLILADGPLQVAEVGDTIGTLEPLPQATWFLALSDDGRFGLFRGAAESADIHQMLAFDFESSSPLDPHSLGTTRSNNYDIAFGSDWAVWTTGDCAAGGVKLSGELTEVVELADADRFYGFAIAPETARLYSKGVTFEDPLDPEELLDPPPPELSFRALDGDSPAPTMLLAHPLEQGTEVADLVASPIDARHFYEVVDENNANAVLWEHDPESGARAAIGELNGQNLDSLWVPGSSATRPVVLRLGSSCSN